jgi:hypothetical protein
VLADRTVPGVRWLRRLLGSTSPGAASAPRAADGVADLVARLPAGPARLSDLEGVIGPVDLSFRSEDQENRGFLFRPRLGDRGEHSPLIPRLTIRYAWDMHHQDPTRPRDVELLECRLQVRGDLAEVETAVLDRFGPSRQVVEHGQQGSTTWAASPPLYVADGHPGLVQVAWFAATPRFAVPEPDAAARQAWLAELAAVAQGARSVDEVDGFCRAAPPGVGIHVTGPLNQRLNPYAEFTFPLEDARDHWIRFVPPVNASALATAFGWSPAVAVSHDVHMASWHLQQRGAGWRPITGALQHWEVEARLTTAPSGPPDAGFAGPNGARAVGAADEVATLALRPRFR